MAGRTRDWDRDRGRVTRAADLSPAETRLHLNNHLSYGLEHCSQKRATLLTSETTYRITGNISLEQGGEGLGWGLLERVLIWGILQHGKATLELPRSCRRAPSSLSQVVTFIAPSSDS